MAQEISNQNIIFLFLPTLGKLKTSKQASNRKFPLSIETVKTTQSSK